MKKKTVVLRFSLLASAITLAGVIGGCGGGGGGGGGAPIDNTPPGGAAAGITSKGILIDAKVTAICVSNGKDLGSMRTGSSGEYSLSWTDACPSPVKIVVEGDNDTTMLDEATGTAPISANGITLRAYVADATQKAPVNVTPLTSMAAAVAENAATKNSGTLTADIVKGATQAIIDKVLGGNTLAYSATPVKFSDVANNEVMQEQQVLMATLTAISALANNKDPSVACTGANDDSAAARIQCAIDAFETQAKLTITNVSATKRTYVEPTGDTPYKMITDKLTAIRTDATNAGIAPAVAIANAGALAAIKLTTLAVVEPPSQDAKDEPTTPAASGIYAARDMFLSLYGDLTSLTGSSGFISQTIGPDINPPLSTVNGDWNAYGIGSGRSFINIFQALTRATDMAYEAKNSAWTVTGATAANSLYDVPGNAGLYLLTDQNAAPVAYVRRFFDSDLQNTQNFMYCKVVLVNGKANGNAACYYADTTDAHGLQADFDVTAETPTGSYHAVTVEETASGHYTWNDFTNLTVTSAKSGEAVITRTSGVVTAASLTGDVQSLVTGLDHSTLNVNATVNTQTGTQTYAINSGAVNNLDTSGATQSSISLSSGSQLVVTTGSAPHTSSVTMVTQIKTPHFQYDGTLAMSNFTASKNNEYSPALSTFNGKVSKLSGGVATEILSGSIKAELTNLADYDPRLKATDTGYVLLREKDTFSGTVTVSSTKSFTLSSLTIDNSAETVTETVTDGITKRVANGRRDTLLTYINPASQSYTVSGVAYKDATKSTVTAAGPGGVVVTLTGGVGKVTVNGTEVGTVNMKASVTQQVRLYDSATNTTILM